MSKQSEKVHLHLSGSQIHLATRPRVGSGKVNGKGKLLANGQTKRPMSAMPASEYQKRHHINMPKLGNWCRPLSADNPYYPDGISSMSSSLYASELDIPEVIEELHLERKHKIAANFALLDPISNFSKDIEVCEEGQITTRAPTRADFTNFQLFTDNARFVSPRSDKSEGKCYSEISLGEKIIIMAQRQYKSETNVLKSDISAKPPLHLHVNSDCNTSSPKFLNKNNLLITENQNTSSGNSAGAVSKTDIESQGNVQKCIQDTSGTTNPEIDKCNSGTIIPSSDDNVGMIATKQNEIEDITMYKDNKMITSSTMSITDSCNFSTIKIQTDVFRGNHDTILKEEFSFEYKQNMLSFPSEFVLNAERETDLLLEQLSRETKSYDLLEYSTNPCGDNPYQRDLSKYEDSNLKNLQLKNVNLSDPFDGNGEQNSCPNIEDSGEGNSCPKIEDNGERNSCPKIEDSGEWNSCPKIEDCCEQINWPKIKKDGITENLNENTDIICNGKEAKEKSSNDFCGDSGVEHSSDECKDGDTVEIKQPSFEEIVNILEILEEDDTLDNQQHKENVLLFEETEQSDKEQASSCSKKLKDILSYLDHLDESCTITLDTAKSRLQSVQDIVKQSESKLASLPKLDDLLNMSTVDLAHEVLRLRLQLEEKSNSVSLLQETLNEQREIVVRNSRNADKELRSRLKQQKNEYEAIIDRHQKFIDQLIADKKNLSEKCESVIKELRSCEERFSSNLKAMEERHAVELQKAKQMHAAAEKIRRERWIDVKTQKIKEMTVKGLEPELQRMTVRHQQELSDLRALHKQELEELELRAARRTAQQMEQLREQLISEKEEAIAKERETLRHRFDKQVEEDEIAYQEQRRRLMSEIQKEKERVTELEIRMKQNYEEAKQHLIREHTKQIEVIKHEYEDTFKSVNRKHQNELKSVKDTYEIEKEAWMYNFQKKQSAVMKEKDAEIREQCRRERDREIESVIEKLENEATAVKLEYEQATENRIKRMQEKFDTELRDLETLEATWKKKFNDIKNKLSDKEDELIVVQTSFRQLNKELSESRKIMDRMSSERANIKEIVRSEFVEQLCNMEKEIVKLREEMAANRTKYQLDLLRKNDEINVLKTEKEQELQEVYDRVKIAIAKKDKAIQVLKVQYDASLEQCQHLENLLEQQRKSYLLK